MEACQGGKNKQLQLLTPGRPAADVHVCHDLTHCARHFSAPAVLMMLWMWPVHSVFRQTEGSSSQCLFSYKTKLQKGAERMGGVGGVRAKHKGNLIIFIQRWLDIKKSADLMTSFKRLISCPSIFLASALFHLWWKCERHQTWLFLCPCLSLYLSFSLSPSFLGPHK